METKIVKSNTLVELKNVYKTYKNKNALNGVNLTINPGDRIGVIGANGSGKSTMSEIIGGIRKPTSGEVIKKEDLIIGLQFQESKYPLGITVIDMIKYYLETFSIPMKESELNNLLDTYQINGFKNKFISSLSGGQQQRLNILLSLIHNPDLVILDEVSTGLDIEVRTEIFNFIKENVIEKNKALFLVTHMMSEIEELCDKYIYVDNGEIKDSGLVKDIVKKYGSVHSYTWAKFKEDKHKPVEEIKTDKKQKKIKENKFDKIINSEKEKGKNLPLVKLLFKYYLKGGAVPFFVFFFPILLLFLEGFAFKGMFGSAENPLIGEAYVHQLIGALSAMQIIATGVFIVPQTILEFKNSVLMKRIGATNIKPTFFVITVNLAGVALMLLGYFWTLLWAGIMFGNGPKGWEMVWTNLSGTMLLFLLLILVSSISLGMMLASIFKSTTTYIAVSNVIYMPIAFLSGAFMPADLINQSPVLQYATYINLFKYCLDPYMMAWNAEWPSTTTIGEIVQFNFTYVEGIYVGVAIALATIYAVIASKSLKWEN